MATLYNIIYHNILNDRECADRIGFDTLEDAIDHAKINVAENEMVYIESNNSIHAFINVDGTVEYDLNMPEISNIKEAAEEFFDYADSLGVGGLL